MKDPTHEPPDDEQIDHAIRRIEECELSMDDSEGLVAMLAELKRLRAPPPPPSALADAIAYLTEARRYIECDPIAEERGVLANYDSALADVRAVQPPGDAQLIVQRIREWSLSTFGYDVVEKLERGIDQRSALTKGESL